MLTLALSIIVNITWMDRTGGQDMTRATTAAEFAGGVVLVGVQASSLTAANFN